MSDTPLTDSRTPSSETAWNWQAPVVGTTEVPVQRAET